MVHRNKEYAEKVNASTSKESSESPRVRTRDPWDDVDLATVGDDVITLDEMTLAGIRKNKNLLDMIVDGIDQGLLGYRDSKKEAVYVFDGDENESVGHFTVYSKGSTLTMLQANVGLRAYFYNMMGTATDESEKLREQAIEQLEQLQKVRRDMPFACSNFKCGPMSMQPISEEDDEDREGSPPERRGPAAGGAIAIHNAEEFFQALSLKNALLAAVGQQEKEENKADLAAEERDDDSIVIREGETEDSSPECSEQPPSTSLSNIDPLEAIMVTWQSRTRSPFGIAGLTKLDENIETTDMNISRSFFSGASVSVEEEQDSGVNEINPSRAEI